MAIGSRHAGRVKRLVRLFDRRIGDTAVVGCQLAVNQGAGSTGVNIDRALLRRTTTLAKPQFIPRLHGSIGKSVRAGDNSPGATHSSAPGWSAQFLKAEPTLPPGLGIQHPHRSGIV
jgi:hypothetical protein